jgi:hypothetical protein
VKLVEELVNPGGRGVRIVMGVEGRHRSPAIGMGVGCCARLEDELHHVLAEGTVGLELFLVVELVESGVVGERVVGGLHPQDISGLVVCKRAFDVEQDAALFLSGVADFADGVVGVAEAVEGGWGDASLRFDVDLDAKVATAAVDGVAKVSEGELGISICVGADDESNMAADEFVDAEIFEVSAIGQVDISGAVSGLSKQFLEEVPDAGGILLPAAGMAGIARPPTETNIEECEKGGDTGGGVITAIG